MRTTKFCVAALVLVLTTVSAAVVHARRAGPSVAARVVSSDVYRHFDVNNLNMWLANSGQYAFPFEGQFNGGLLFPKGSVNNALYGAGIWIGAKIGNEIRTACGDYQTDWTPGAMLDSVPDDPAKPEYRTYKVVRYLTPADTAHLDHTAAELAATPGLDRLAHDSWSDYMAGAASHGAPWKLYRLPQPGAPGDSVDVPGPDVIGDQMLWSVYNDATSLSTHVRTLGIEVQQTTFGFNRQGALGNTLFLKFTIINKGTHRLDSLFVSTWSDPDLGDFGDDLVGCDTTLALDFCYNADNHDRTYGSAPPSPGFDFFLGPVDKATGDTLGLFSFDKYISGTDPGTPNERYNDMRGLTREGNVVIDPTTGHATRFFHPGDPVTGQGWLDSQPSDRRMMMTSGPVTMAPGDTQIVVAAIILGQGTDRLSSVAALKFNDRSAQDAFDRNFNLPSPPSAPVVHAVTAHGTVRLCWDQASRTNYQQQGYRFEGYNVYQGASVAGPWKRIATYDEIDNVRIITDEVFDLNTGQVIPNFPVAFGSDAGMAFCQTVTQDAIRGGPLQDASEYFFAVTAYAYSADERPHMLETAQQPIRVRVQRPASGTDDATAHTGITIVQADASLKPTTDVLDVTVVDPAAVTGHDYRISFTTLNPPVSGQVGADTATVRWAWNIEDVTAGRMLAQRLLNRRGDDDYAVIDGLQFRLIGDYFQFMKDGWYDNLNSAHDAQWGDNSGGMPFYFGAAGTGTQYSEVSSSLDPAAQPDSFISVDITFDQAHPRKAYRYLRLEVSGGTDPPPGGSRMLYGGFHDVPFTVRDALGHPLAAAFIERAVTDSSGSLLPASQQPATYDSTWSPTAESGNGEIALVLDRPYGTTPDPAFERDGALLDGTMPLMYALALQLNPDSPGIDDGDQFHFVWAVPATPNDTFYVASHALVRGDAALARSRLDRIRVVPNPYYAQSRYELTAVNHVVRFINLPETATIRVYNLAGHLARTLHKTDPTSSELDWDLNTDNGLPVASGVYVFRVEAPGVGSYVGRMAIFMEKESLTNY